jgi:hypothetical protein
VMTASCAGIADLKGGADRLVVCVTNRNMSSAGLQNASFVLTLESTTSSIVVNNLIPDTMYSVTLTVVVWGGANITSDPVNVQTMVGSMLPTAA